MRKLNKGWLRRLLYALRDQGSVNDTIMESRRERDDARYQATIDETVSKAELLDDLLALCYNADDPQRRLSLAGHLIFSALDGYPILPRIISMLEAKRVVVPHYFVTRREHS